MCSHELRRFNLLLSERIVEEDLIYPCEISVHNIHDDLNEFENVLHIHIVTFQIDMLNQKLNTCEYFHIWYICELSNTQIEEWNLSILLIQRLLREESNRVISLKLSLIVKL